MTGPQVVVALIGIATLALSGVLTVRWLERSSIERYLQQRRRARERKLWEDVLRQILQMEQDGRVVSPESLAGAMGKSLASLRSILSRMGEHDLIVERNYEIHLTSGGKRWALHILRAHRLWESYLADEARLPMGRLHNQAEAVEHRLTER
ncbi:MAG: hypothetical protein LC114_26955, partial [Bryobacterales bacterium]|nr:hypothetical protein [Bryobacterales bacterium]